MKKGKFRQLVSLVKIGSSLYVIGTSIYDICQDVTVMRKEHGLLLIGLVGLGKSCYEAYVKGRELNTDIVREEKIVERV